MEATSPVNCIEGGVLVDLCKQRSGERGSGCNAPEEIYKSPILANVSWKFSEGSPTPVTSPLMPPKPARTGRKQYSWQNPSKKDVCMHIRIFNPLEFRKEKKELTFKSQESMNCQHRMDDMVASSNSDVTRKAVWEPDESRLVARKHSVTREQLSSFVPKSFKAAFNACNRFINYMLLFLATITSVLKGLTNIVRYGRKCLVGNSDSLAQRESSRDYSCNYFICVLRKVMGYILGFSKELWLFIILGCKWEENKPFRNEREEKGKARNMWIFRFVIAVSGLRNL